MPHGKGPNTRKGTEIAAVEARDVSTGVATGICHLSRTSSSHLALACSHSQTHALVHAVQMITTEAKAQAAEGSDKRAIHQQFKTRKKGRLVKARY